MTVERWVSDWLEPAAGIEEYTVVIDPDIGTLAQLLTSVGSIYFGTDPPCSILDWPCVINEYGARWRCPDCGTWSRQPRLHEFQCPGPFACGHPRSEENLRYRGRDRYGEVYSGCEACETERQRRKRRK